MSFIIRTTEPFTNSRRAFTQLEKLHARASILLNTCMQSDSVHGAAPLAMRQELKSANCALWIGQKLALWKCEKGAQGAL